MAIELNKQIVVTKADAKAALANAQKEGFNPIANGLGLADGEYKFTTAATDHMGIMPVQSRKNQAKIALTYVQGRAEGRGEQEGITKDFTDRNICVISSTAWEQTEPNQDYVMVVEGGYVRSFELLSA